MLLLVLIAAFCSLAAFILNLLCILAGSSTTFLQNAEILTVQLSDHIRPAFAKSLQVNTSMLGHIMFNGSGDGRQFLGQIEGQAEGAINGLVDDAAEALGIHDFYSIHLLDFCEV